MLTQAKKLEHTKALKDVVLSHGFKKDKFNNYLTRKKEIRIRFKNIRVLIESKGYYGYQILKSKSIIRTTAQSLTSFINKIK